MALSDVPQLGLAVMIVGVTFIVTHRLLSTISKSPSVVPLARANPKPMTCRIRGIPIEWGQPRLRSYLKEQGCPAMSVKSLATEIDNTSRTATATFLGEYPPRLGLELSHHQAGPTLLTLDHDFYGITTLYAPPSEAHKLDIIAVSGLGGHAFGSFKERDGQHMWLRDALADDLFDPNTKQPMARIMVYGQDSRVACSNSMQDLEDMSISFRASLRPLIRTPIIIPIVFIGHSLGGLIVKQALAPLIALTTKREDELERLARAIRGILFFGVPHDGMEIDGLKQMAGNGLNRFLIESLSCKNSAVLTNLRRDFNNFMDEIGDAEIFCFYETEMSGTPQKDVTGKWKMEGEKTVLVAKTSATHCGQLEHDPGHICGIARSHSEMVKFARHDHEYHKVRDILQLVAQKAVGAKSQIPLDPLTKACLKSLAFPEMDYRSNDIVEAVQGTCDWLVNHDAYKRWLYADRGLFWVKGKPGSGKSTLMRHILEHSRKHTPKTGAIVVSFFFHGRGTELQKTPLGFFRSILHQLLCRLPATLQGLIAIFQQRRETIGEPGEKWRWHENELRGFLKRSLLKALKNHRMRLFVDALDESGKESAVNLVKGFRLLLQEMPSHGKSFHIFFTSRHYPILDGDCELRVCLEHENKRDVSTYVQAQLAGCPNLVQSVVPNMIAEQAKGDFMWASLVVRKALELDIEGKTLPTILSRIKDTPRMASSHQQKQLLEEALGFVKGPRMTSETLPYRGIPYLRNPSFFSRSNYMEALSSALDHNNIQLGLLRVALVGLGGCGKTQIALEYAYRAQAYDAVLWCAAESSLRLTESYTAHARALGLVGEGEMPQQEHVKNLLKQWLVNTSRGATRWLIILDNVEDFNELSSYWPVGASGSVIVTTRSPLLAKKYAEVQVPVSVLDPVEASQFLLDFRALSVSPSDEEKTVVGRIANKLGSLPLALDLIRHYVFSTGSSYSEFLQSYDQFNESFLYNEAELTWQNQWYPATITTTYTYRLKQMSDDAVLMMHILSFLDPNQISISFFKTDSTSMLFNGPDVRDEVPELQDWLHNPFLEARMLDKAVAELLDSSLVVRTVGMNMLSLHRVAQSAVAFSMDASIRFRIFHKVLFFLNDRFPGVQDGGLLYPWWIQCEQYAPHVAAITKFYKHRRSELGTPIMLCEIIRRCAWYLLEKYQFADAKRLVQDAIDICEEAQRTQAFKGYTKHRYLPRLLADLYTVMGSLECESHTDGHGLAWALKARSIRQELCDRLQLLHDKMAFRVDQNNIGVDLLANDQPQQALPILQEVYASDMASGGISVSNWYRTINLSLCLRILGQYDEAIKYSDTAIKVVGDHIGHDGVPMAAAQFFLGNLLLCKRDTVAAFEAFSKCFQIRQKLMPTHFDTAFVCHKLGVIARENGDSQASLTFFTEALRILGDIGPLSLAATRTAYLLSCVMEENGQHDAARALKQRVDQTLDANGEKENASCAQYSLVFFDKFILFKNR